MGRKSSVSKLLGIIVRGVGVCQVASQSVVNPMDCLDPLSMGFSRQEYWSGLPCSPPGDLPDPRMKPMSLTSPSLAGGFFTTSTT